MRRGKEQRSDEAGRGEVIEEGRGDEEGMERRENHKLREETAGGVLCPEAFEGVVGGGGEEAKDEVVGKNPHAQVDGHHVQQPQ